MTTPPLPEQIELHRERMWRRDEEICVESAVDAERFIEDVGFANTLTDARRAGPSLFILRCAVGGMFVCLQLGFHPRQHGFLSLGKKVLGKKVYAGLTRSFRRNQIRRGLRH
jgi:hypothetical protein